MLVRHSQNSLLIITKKSITMLLFAINISTLCYAFEHTSTLIKYFPISLLIQRYLHKSFYSLFLNMTSRSLFLKPRFGEKPKTYVSINDWR